MQKTPGRIKEGVCLLSASPSALNLRGLRAQIATVNSILSCIYLELQPQAPNPRTSGNFKGAGARGGVTGGARSRDKYGRRAKSSMRPGRKELTGTRPLTKKENLTGTGRVRSPGVY
jgi:hypothetical protein